MRLRFHLYFHRYHEAALGKHTSFLSMLMLCATLALHTDYVRADEAFAVEATLYGDAVQVNVRATIKAPIRVIWNTLTDYDHMADFIPGMEKSRLLERNGNRAVVEQSGYAHLWFLRFPIDATVEVNEQAPTSIRTRLMNGNLKRLEGTYEIEKIADGESYLLRWSGTIEPEANIPTFLAASLMRKNIAEQFHGMLKEIARRAKLSTPQASPS